MLIISAPYLERVFPVGKYYGGALFPPHCRFLPCGAAQLNRLFLGPLPVSGTFPSVGERPLGCQH